MYISDTLYYQGEQKRLTVRYADIVNPNEKAEDTRTGDEIAEDVISRLNLKMVGGE